MVCVVVCSGTALMSISSAPLQFNRWQAFTTYYIPKLQHWCKYKKILLNRKCILCKNNFHKYHRRRQESGMWVMLYDVSALFECFNMGMGNVFLCMNTVLFNVCKVTEYIIIIRVVDSTYLIFWVSFKHCSFEIWKETKSFHGNFLLIHNSSKTSQISFEIYDRYYYIRQALFAELSPQPGLLEPGGYLGTLGSPDKNPGSAKYPVSSIYPGSLKYPSSWKYPSGLKYPGSSKVSG